MDEANVALSTPVQERFFSLGLFGAEHYLEMCFFSIESRKVALVHALTTE